MVEQPSARSENRVVPSQLPISPPWFVGRVDELAQLTRLLGDTSAPSRPANVVTINGTAGIGKTWLALHWAHQCLEEFPDGQLYVNLRGFDPAGKPVEPIEVLHGFLDALGTPPGWIPVDQEGR